MEGCECAEVAERAASGSRMAEREGFVMMRQDRQNDGMDMSCSRPLHVSPASCHTQGPLIVLHLQALPPLFCISLSLSHSPNAASNAALRTAHGRYTSPHHASTPQTLPPPVLMASSMHMYTVTATTNPPQFVCSCPPAAATAPGSRQRHDLSVR